jgi:hypothetical protein
MSKKRAPTFKIDETGMLLKEPTGDYILFRGTISEMREYMKWYKGSNNRDLSIVDHNVFIVHKGKD